MGTVMSQQEFARWGRRRGQGRLRFIALYGVLLGGVLGAALYLTSMWFLVGKEYFAQTLSGVPMVVIISVLTGAVAAFLAWEIKEMRYRTTLEDEQVDK